MGRYIPPSAFHTFEPLRHDPLELIPLIQASQGGDHGEIQSITKFSNTIQNLVEGQPPELDAATMLFLTAVSWQEDGSSPEPLDKAVSRERIGRFPIEGGNAISYLHEFTNDKGNGALHDLLAKLALGLEEEYLGEPGFSSGAAGLHLCGWLSASEVTSLHRVIRRGKWGIDPSEPLDGGVNDAFRHLTIILRSARKRRCGLLMRRHA